jgi:sugar lactone lactonase YvrE/subtilisin-like proprotein convertase family protein
MLMAALAWLKKFSLFAQQPDLRPQRRRTGRSRCARPTLDRLEERALPSGTANWAFPIVGGVDTGQLAVDSQSNILMAGSFSGKVNFDPVNTTTTLDSSKGSVFVAKYTTNDTLAWAQQMTAGDATGVATDASGNLYVTGFFSGKGTFGSTNLTSAGGNDVFITKLDPTGQFLWATRFGGFSDDEGARLAVDNSGNVFFTGYFSGTVPLGSFVLQSRGGQDAFVAKLSSAGTILWATDLGGYGTDRGMDVKTDPFGNAYVTGQFSGTASFGPYSLTSKGGTDIFVAELNSGGSVLWAGRMGGEANTTDEAGTSLAVDSRSSNPSNWAVYVTGSFNGTTADFGAQTFSSAGDDIFVAKLAAANGSFTWARQLGGAGQDRGEALALDGGGNVYTTGLFGMNGSAADFDPGPGARILTPSSGQEAYLSKLDGNGNYAGVWQLGSTSSVEGRGVAVDGAGVLYAGGLFQQQASLPDNLTVSATQTTPNGLYLLKLTQDHGEIAGRVFNSNGIGGTGGLAWPGSSVYLDLQGDGKLDPGDPTATTDAFGQYVFNWQNVGPPLQGTYTVRQVLPAGWVQTSPPGGAAQTVTLSAGQFVDEVNFSDTPTKTYSYANSSPQTIPDGKTITSTITLPDSFTIYDLNVVLTIAHGKDSDLTVSLTGPDKTSVTLFAGVGGSGKNFTGTTLDDEATVSISAGTAPFSGSFKPQNPLSAFDLKNSQGTWTLTVSDTAANLIGGTLLNWSLQLLGPEGPVPPPGGIVSWWPAEGDTQDIAGGNSGMLTTGVTFAPGAVGQAFHFGGTGDYFQAPTSGLPTGNSDRTLELWVNVQQFVASEAQFAAYGNFGTNGQTYGLGASGNRLFFSQWGNALLGPSLQAGVWYHLAVTNVGNSVTLYLDGTAVATGTLPINTAGGTQFYMGSLPSPYGANRRLQGFTDEAAVYNRALSAAEIQAIYNAGPAGKNQFYVSASSPGDGGLVQTPPSDFVLNLSQPYDPATVQASDLVVNGIPADAVALTGPQTLTFHFQTSPVTTQGLQAMQLAGPAIRASGSETALAAWSGTFRYDVVLMQVTATNPVPGSLLTVNDSPGGVVATLQLTLNEPYAPSSVNAGNLVLSQGKVTAVSLTSATSITYTLGGLHEGVVSVRLPLGAITDVYSNPLPNPFAAAYDVDVGTVPFAATFQPQYPAASLIYQGSVGGIFNSQVPPFVFWGSGGLSGPGGLVVGPDGNWYVSSSNSNQVLRYDPTGAFLGAFVSAGSGGLVKPTGLAFGPDGALYVSSTGTDQVLRYKGTTGAFVGVFASASSLKQPGGLVFRPDGYLYVVGTGSNNVVRFDAGTGAYVSDFVPAGTSGLAQPQDLTFGPDGNLYVSNFGKNTVLRYSGTAGTLMNIFVTAGSGGLGGPAGLRFGPDNNLYVVSNSTSAVLSYNGSTGAFLNPYVSPGAGGIAAPTFLSWGPDGKLYVSNSGNSSVLRYDGTTGGPGDVDSYTLALDANQTLALRVTAAVAPTITLTHSVLGSITLPPDLDPGPGLLYQPVQFRDASGNPVAGTVTITIQAPTGLTIGSYGIQATLNAQWDVGSANSTAVQSLAPSTIDVEPGPVTINRAAVQGTLDSTAQRIYVATPGVVNDLRGSWDPTASAKTWKLNGSGNPYSTWNNGVVGTVSYSTPVETFSFTGYAGDSIVISARWNYLLNGTFNGSYDPMNLVLTDPNGGKMVAGHILTPILTFTIPNHKLTVTGTYTITVSSGLYEFAQNFTVSAQLVTSADPRGHHTDVYSLPATAGTYVSVAAATGSVPVGQPQVQFALFAPGVNPITGTPLAVSAPVASLDGWLELQVPVTGTYAITVTGTTGYTLVAVSNGSFRPDGTDNSFSFAQDLTGRPGALGDKRTHTTAFVPGGSGGLNDAIGATIGPDGNLYVSSLGGDEVMRYNGTTGAPDPISGQSGAIFVTQGLGKLQAPEYLRFGPDGNLYVVDSATNQVFSYNGTTGAFISIFVTAANNGGLKDPVGLAFDAKGNLYVGGAQSNNIVEFDANGNPTVFVPASANGGLTSPEGLAFGPDGNLYVSSNGTNQVLKYDGKTGAFLGTFVAAGGGGLAGPAGLAFGPDGSLFVSSAVTAQVLHYQGPGGSQPGAFLDVFVPAGAAGLVRPTDLVFDGGGNLYLSTQSQSSVLKAAIPPDFYRVALAAGQTATFTTSTPGDGPGQPVNALAPHIELYDASLTLLTGGKVLADGRNETITFTAPATSVYYIKLDSKNFTQGDYVLDPVETDGTDTRYSSPAPETAIGRDEGTPARDAMEALLAGGPLGFHLPPISYSKETGSQAGPVIPGPLAPALLLASELGTTLPAEVRRETPAQESIDVVFADPDFGPFGT